MARSWPKKFDRRPFSRLFVLLPTIQPSFDVFFNPNSGGLLALSVALYVTKNHAPQPVGTAPCFSQFLLSHNSRSKLLKHHRCNWGQVMQQTNKRCRLVHKEIWRQQCPSEIYEGINVPWQYDRAYPCPQTSLLYTGGSSHALCTALQSTCVHCLHKYLSSIPGFVHPSFHILHFRNDCKSIIIHHLFLKV